MEISRENYIIVKDAFRQELKSRAKELRELKQTVKVLQRNLEIRESSYKQSHLDVLRYNYRTIHVAYSLFKGKTYEQIEPKVREGNEINLDLVNRTMNDYITKYSVKEESVSNA